MGVETVTEFIIVFATVSSLEEGLQIANQLVEEKLAACCNLVKDLTSVYIWDNNLCKDREYLLIMKSRLDKFDDLMKKIKEIHSYKVPEIIALPIIAGSKEYLKWLDDMIK
jgi:periplasmic divalent cation tolerance protein